MTFKLVLSRLQIAVLMIGLAAAATGCKNDNPTDASATVTTDDAADAVAASLSADASGVSTQTADAATVASGSVPAAKGESVQVDTTVTKTRSGNNGVSSYNYSLTYTYTQNGAAQPSMSFGYTAVGQYSLPRVSSNDNTTAAWTLTALNAASLSAAAEIKVGGSYTRNGSQTSKVRSLNSFTSAISYNLTDVVVNRVSRTLKSGTMAVSISGSTTSGNAFSYTGTITINSSVSATLVLNGVTYTINITTGTVA